MPESDRGNDDESPEERIVIANGMDLDKRYFYEVTKQMSSDGDLWKLSRLGPPLWTVLSLIGLGLAVTGIIRGLRTLFTVAVSAINWSDPPPWIAVAVLGTIVAIVALVLVLVTFVSDFIDVERIKDRLTDLRNVARRDVWQNLHYWHQFTSHLSDRDPIVPLSAESEREVSSIYADGPHYQNVFVDALYVTPDGDLSFKEKTSFHLYRWDHRRRTIRRVLYAVALIAVVVLVLRLLDLVDMSSLGTSVGAATVVLSMAALVVVLATIVSVNYLYLQVQFYSDSAGLSRYGQLLNDQEKSYFARGEQVGLSNSMCGYGLFYVSRFVATLFGNRQFDVEIDPATLAPGAPVFRHGEADEGTIELVFDRPVKITGREGFTVEVNETVVSLDDVNAVQGNKGRIALHLDPDKDVIGTSDVVSVSYDGDSLGVIDEDGTGVEGFSIATDTNDEFVNVVAQSDGREADASIHEEGEGKSTEFPARGFKSHPGDEHATAAAAEILWSSLPAESIHHQGRESDVTLHLEGVDYYTVEETSDGEDELVKATAGERTGFRLPVKKFLSVRDGFEADALRIPEQPADLLYAGDWSEEELHTLFVGGGEHQQAINKLVLALKADGYQNVDVRENAFAVGRTPGLTRMLRRRVRKSLASNEEESENEADDKTVHFPTEYFVSLVSGGNEFFRQDPNRHGHGFLLFRHELDETERQHRYAHVLIGMSAVGTKTGALFWQHLLENDFELGLDGDNRFELEEDVVYFFDAPGPTDHPICNRENGKYDDIGDLYTDTAWQDRGLIFGLSELDHFETIDKSIDKKGNKKFGTEYYDVELLSVRNDF
jgi:small-conductance mechanosensitive channel